MAELDAEAVRNLVARLAHLADDGGVEEYLALLTETASWGHDGGERLVGKDQVRSGVLGRRAAGIQGPGSGRRHINTTLVVEVDGSSARSESYYLYIAKRAGGWDVVKSGRYRDTFKATAEGWKLDSRTISDD